MKLFIQGKKYRNKINIRKVLMKNIEGFLCSFHHSNFYHVFVVFVLKMSLVPNTVPTKFRLLGYE